MLDGPNHFPLTENSSSHIPESLRRNRLPDWPRASEPELVRHYTKLSQKNFGIDTGFYPLGSCTMKHNPRLNEKIVQNPGIDRIHPLQPEEQIQGLFGDILRDAGDVSDLLGNGCGDPPAGCRRTR